MRPLRSLIVLALASALLGPALASCAASRQSAPAPRANHRRAIVISCDGGGDKLIDRMIDGGHMPHLAAIRAQGLVADYARTSFPAKTAPGHASLWTGAYGDRSGILSNHPPILPLSAHDLNEHTDGFDVDALQIEPVWVAAARQGKRTILVQATHTTPISAYQKGGRFADVADKVRIVDFYKGQMGRNTHAHYGPDVPRTPSTWPDAPPGSLSMELPGEKGTGTMPALLSDDPGDPRRGFDTLALSPTRRWKTAVKLKSGRPGQFSSAVPWPESGGRYSFFRLWELSADAQTFRLTRTPISRQTTNHPTLPSLPLGAVAGGPEKLYADGGLGPTVMQGGDGTAESRYVEAITLTLDNRLAVARSLLTAGEDWDLTCMYVPFPDAASHMWLGLLDPTSPHYEPKRAAVIAKALAGVFAAVDRFIGAVATIEPTAALAVVSDHGLDSVHWDFYPNVLLARAGLLALQPNGEIDLSRTRVLYPVHDGAALVVNRVAFKGGIVTDAEIPHLLERSRRALLAAKDPRSQKPVVTAFWQPDAALGNTGYGDLYLDLAPGYYFHPRTLASSWWSPRPALASGGHIFHPERPSMHAMFALRGPGIPARPVGAVRTIDVIPTVCDYLGIGPPDQAVGRSLMPAPGSDALP